VLFKLIIKKPTAVESNYYFYNILNVNREMHRRNVKTLKWVEIFINEILATYGIRNLIFGKYQYAF